MYQWIFGISMDFWHQLYQWIFGINCINELLASIVCINGFLEYQWIFGINCINGILASIVSMKFWHQLYQ
jgi:hypothetical protein